VDDTVDRGDDDEGDELTGEAVFQDGVARWPGR
jgi:hypothetical protein